MYSQTSNIISIDVNIDGFSPFQSSKMSVWPIIGAISNVSNASPFLIGCLCGPSKPESNNDYLNKFVNEIISLKKNGVQTKYGIKPFDLRIIVCDTPARAYITGTQYHTGKESCPKCSQIGITKERKLAFQANVSTLRTNEDFAVWKYPRHHRPEFLNTKVMFEHVYGIKMVE